MKPILVLQHLNGDAPAYLATWLAEQQLGVDVRNAQAGDAYPPDISRHAALAVLGGAMSANDDLPSLRQAERLIRGTMQRGAPVIGHCLGGQLMARALGARVVASPLPEVGWQTIQIEGHGAAQAAFAGAACMQVMQWHEEAFELPRGAQRLASSPAMLADMAACLGPQQALARRLYARWLQTLRAV